MGNEHSELRILNCIKNVMKNGFKKHKQARETMLFILESAI